ncbi:peptidylprolyl isomerase [Limosilactobacillus coleohominis]|uniref:Foldase protein PrsA n=1 Tax=Limosilactobacillus coleohominis TaxID=181675 RepID=A0ABS2GXJ3_9LACO|nr:peptidylprolyl isomerase [Limosilactobacillus coleohominis]MCI5812222.1 peptidylprolyl isomerase [Lactobacillus sp.]MBM6940546.1 peptidylprolyl isomerase [Limosilactobacillus coleohominis]MBM6954839.1 peptidylprolyl isomerase [Limosilactobacillus coleohominis]MDY3702516.1 peptidylprolyl isomerase [Limosilactobacillus coleohominis]MDY5629167.1 peptidylprolyl isomerase [Limosilactobacillus coleohominis]
MKSKKLLAIIAGIAVMMPLAACGNKAVATTSGGKITQDEYYSSMKSTSQGKAVLQQMILDKVLQKQYGKEVSKADVNKEYNSYKSQYGSSFSAVLEQQGLTEKSFKDQIKSRLLLQAAVRHYSTFSNSAINKQWKKYEPKVQTAEILVGSEDDANDIINQLNSASGNKYKKFKKLAKSKSTDSSNKSTGGIVPAFDNTSTSVDSAYKKAAFKLKTGEYTKEPVKTDNGYQVIYMVKHPAKGAKSAHISDLKTQIVEQNMNNQSFMEKVISKVLKKGNVSIKDKDLQNILSQYLNPSANSGATTSNSSSSSASSSASSDSSN